MFLNCVPFASLLFPAYIMSVCRCTHTWAHMYVLILSFINDAEIISESSWLCKFIAGEKSHVDLDFVKKKITSIHSIIS